MKTLSVFLAVMALFFTDVVFANAVVTSMTGTAQAQVGTGAARSLRQGDEVAQGATVFTGANSSVVLKFDDGQVAALTSNSRMTITTYEYNPQTKSGNVLLSLIDGGMRAITGLIGRGKPENVAYRAASATIGIRGTDVTIVTTAGNVVVTVTEGAISFTYEGKTITVPAGQGVNAKTNQPFQAQAAQTILSQLPPNLVAALNGLGSLQQAINQAAGSPRQGPPDGVPPGPPTGVPPGPPSGVPGGGGGGGGPPSKS
jgi:hypothetical protein